ncbi:hypothetical protein MCOR25_002548 [Pyricularia grisea]|uniref:DEUBAD domain-containing protein n=1 Tax=Pyricularia grisea TaxID=148305 RepID=A0A6P8B1F3_PYRGI|nr:uncharacterized protein PgNI_06865 [Pyricularia grisea]KAI6377566.1 hypothetical protein MCOR25_002548 [Pyricularia grisea]TLD08553.1 hypothetical protein PgNI_06865 [Pyricularia grisea]
MAVASSSSSELSSPLASDDEIYGFESQNRPRTKKMPSPQPREEDVIVVASRIESEEPQDHDTITVANTRISPAVSVKAATPPPLEVTAVNGKESPLPAQVTSDIQPAEIEASVSSIDVAETPSSSCASSRPKRKRESKVQPSAEATAPSPAAKKGLTPAAKRRKKQWEPPFVYTSPNSPLVKKNIDLRAMLCNPLAWDGLSPAQQQSLIPLFPPGFVLDEGTPQARPNTQAMLNSDDFRHDCAQYLTNIRLGRHEPEWILQAQEAHLKRKNGDFDDFLRKKFRDDWGAEPPEGYPEPERVVALQAREKDEEEEHKTEKMTGKTGEIENGVGEDSGRNSEAEVADKPLRLPPQETRQQQEEKKNLDQKLEQPHCRSTTEVVGT